MIPKRTLLHLQMCASLNPHQRRWWLSKRSTLAKVMTVGGHRVLIPKGDIYIKAAPSRAQGSLQKRAGKIARGGGGRKLQWNYVFQIQKCNSACQLNSVCDSMHTLCKDKPNKNLVMEEESGIKVHLSLLAEIQTGPNKCSRNMCWVNRAGSI